MLTTITQDTVQLVSGYWSAVFDTGRPRLASLRGDPRGLGSYCPELIDPGDWGSSWLELASGTLSAEPGDSPALHPREDRLGFELGGLRLGDVATMTWRVALTGAHGSVLRVEVVRELLCEVVAVMEVPFGLCCPRHFAFWSQPSLRFGHHPAEPYRRDYSPRAERRRRRVVGYHSPEAMPEFVIHASPRYPDLAQQVAGGWHHLEQRYTRNVRFGISSRDFSSGPIRLLPGREVFVYTLRPVIQGALAPIHLRMPDPALERDLRAFYDGYLLSAIACDHEYFGNNPYRHAYAPFAIDYVARGYAVADRRAWSPTQGDLDARWERHIRRTLTEGKHSPGRLVALMDSGVWQDRCGAIDPAVGSTVMGSKFVTACCLMLLKSGDVRLARETGGELEAILRVYDGMDPDGDGLLENPMTGLAGCPASGYHDNLSIGHKDGAMNAGAYEAFTLFASLAQWLERPELAAEFERRAARLRRAYNTQLWNEAGGRYVGWIDVQGGVHDAWYTYVNFPAIVAGIADEARAGRIMASFLAHPNHHLLFAAGLNLESDTESNGSKEFGQWLNGCLLLGPAAMELAARAMVLGGESAWELLSGLVAQFRRDGLCGDPIYDWVRFGDVLRREAIFPTFSGKNAFTWVWGDHDGSGTEPYLADGGAMFWALYWGVFGIAADFQGLALRPHVPAALAGSEIAIRLMNRRIVLRYPASGDTLRALRVDGESLSTDRLPWNQLHDGSVIEVQLG